MEDHEWHCRGVAVSPQLPPSNRHLDVKVIHSLLLLLRQAVRQFLDEFKYDNILVTIDGEPRLIDFGDSQFLTERDQCTLKRDRKKYPFYPPELKVAQGEMINGKQADGK